MTHSDVERVRHSRGRSMLLFITDRCPVGCRHCSVDSRADSPSISNFELFEEIVNWLCARPEIEVVGISGGEPFVERRGLTLVSERLQQANKRQVIFTSGVWATQSPTPLWIREVIARCSCIYLSTDAFHSPSVDDERFMRALSTIAATGVWIIVQVLDDEKACERAEHLLRNVFAEDVAAHAQINRIAPLANGRGAGVFTGDSERRVKGHAFGACSLVTSPMVRYDGVVIGCCNENVIMGQGPPRLRKQATSGIELSRAVGEFHRDPLLRVIGDTGLGVLTLHPQLADLGDREFTTNCDLCWNVLRRIPQNADSDPLIVLMAGLDGGNG
jgi:organic radical activating enzyme